MYRYDDSGRRQNMAICENYFLFAFFSFMLGRDFLLVASSSFHFSRFVSVRGSIRAWLVVGAIDGASSGGPGDRGEMNPKEISRLLSFTTTGASMGLAVGFSISTNERSSSPPYFKLVDLSGSVPSLGRCSFSFFSSFDVTFFFFINGFCSLSFK